MLSRIEETTVVYSTTTDLTSPNSLQKVTSVYRKQHEKLFFATRSREIFNSVPNISVTVCDQ